MVILVMHHFVSKQAKHTTYNSSSSTKYPKTGEVQHSETDEESKLVVYYSIRRRKK